MNQIKNPGEDRVVDRTLIESWIRNTDEGKMLTPDEADQFASVALSCNLNPFRRELHARIRIENGLRKLSLVTGFEVYLHRASESGQLDGFSCTVNGEGNTLKATAEVHRKDWSHPFIHEVFFDEVAQRDEQGALLPFWKRSGRYMLRKVCLSQAFRLAFPEALEGLPYEGSELPASLPASENAQGSGVSLPPSSANGQSINGNAKDVAHAISIDAIKERALANKAYLEPHHLSWIISQLLQPKSQKQLEGLSRHLEESIAEGMRNGKVLSLPGAGKPGQSTRKGNVRHMPTQTIGRQKAAGAEDLDIY